MASPILTKAHQSPAALAGTWKLGGGHAATLQPCEPGVLRIAHGSVWATSDGPHQGAPNDQGDLFLHVGERLPLRRGQRLVLEAVHPQQTAYFSWDPRPQEAPHDVDAASLVQPVQDLRAAVLLGADAAGRLVGTFARLAWHGWVGNGRPWLTAH